MWTHWTMYATVFTVVMVLQFNLSTVFTALFWDGFATCCTCCSVLNVIVTFVELRYEDDPMMELPRGHEKDGNAIWDTPAAEDHNMFVCCMFLELGWSCLELELSLNSSWILSWSSGPSVLAISVPLCLCACHVVVWCARLTASGTALWSSMDGLAVQDLHG